MEADFEAWLRLQLRSLKADEEVFLPYLVGILEAEEEDDESKSDDIDELLGGISDCAEDNTLFRQKILDRWKRRNGHEGGGGAQGGTNVDKKMESLDLGATLASISDSQTAAYAAKVAAASNSTYAGPDRAVKDAIMAQYSGAVEESSEDDDGDDAGGDGGGSETRNVNAETLAKVEQEKREVARAAAAAKKEKDKSDREKQKTQAEDRKKKAQEKASKGERRK